MTIGEYILSIDRTSSTKIMCEIYDSIKDESAKPDLEKLQSIDKELDEMFFSVVDKAVIMDKLMENATRILLDRISDIDCGFLNRQLPPHLRR